MVVGGDNTAIGMEVAMNLIDWFLTGGARLTWWVIPTMLVAGFLTPALQLLVTEKVGQSMSLAS